MLKNSNIKNFIPLFRNKRLLVLLVVFFLWSFVVYGSFQYGWIKDFSVNKTLADTAPSQYQKCFIVRMNYSQETQETYYWYICPSGIYYSQLYLQNITFMTENLEEQYTQVEQLKCSDICTHNDFVTPGTTCYLTTSVDRELLWASIATNKPGFKIKNATTTLMVLTDWYNKLFTLGRQSFSVEPSVNSIKGSFVVQTSAIKSGVVATRTLFYVDGAGVHYRSGMCKENKLLGKDGESVVSISAGNNNTCAVMSNGRVKCWGENIQSAVSGTIKPEYIIQHYGINALKSAFPISGLDDSVEVSVATDHFCSRNIAGQVKCWGDNSAEEVVCGTNNNTQYPVVSVLGASIISVGKNFSWTASMSFPNILKRWGEYQSSDFCTGSVIRTPEIISNIGNEVTGLSSSKLNFFGCLVVDNEVRCWHYNTSINNHGVLGGAIDTITPIQINGIKANRDDLISKVAVGQHHVCALLNTGQVKCWGNNEYGQLGNSDGSTYNPTPITISNLNNVIDISAGANFTCTVLNTGQVKCWGDNGSGQLGGTNTTIGERVLVSDINNARSVSCGTSHACAVLNTGQVKCWGDNGSGQLGRGISPIINDLGGYSKTPQSVTIPEIMPVDLTD